VTAGASAAERVEAPFVQALYLYGLVMPDARLPDGLTGVGGEPVRTVSLDDVSALVSDLSDTELIGLPDEVRAHGAVLDAVALSGAVIPIQFGWTAPDVDALASALPAARRRACSDQLRELARVVQLSLTARYDQDAVIAELVSEEPVIHRLRELTRGQPEAATHYERIRLGELVIAGLERKGATDADLLEHRIAPLVVEMRHREVGRPDTVLDAALLVRRDTVGRLEDALEDIAAGLFPRITLRLVGPQAPYDFVEEV
jgi:hypothetical protein